MADTHAGVAIGGNEPPRIADVTKALARIFLEATLDQRADVNRHPSPLGLCANDRGDRLAYVVALERAPRGQHLVEHTSERPDVAALVRRPALGLLGCHVGGRAQQCSDARHHRGRRNRG